MRRPPRVLITLLGIIFIAATTVLTIKLAKGYRPSFKSKALQGTGLLAANSVPRGASVFINDKLTTATDDTLNLPPGEYRVRISQDGYISWEKTLKLQAELVTQTGARLFPAVPDLKPITFSGALNPIASPDGQKLVFGVQNSTNEAKNGLYVLDLQDHQFSFGSDSPRQITRSQPKYDFTQAELAWTPDSSQILATLNPGKDNSINVLLDQGGFNDTADLKDVTARLPLIFNEWDDYLDKQNHERLKELPDLVQEIATASAAKFSFSPDSEMLLYLAKAKATLPENLIPSLPSSSTQTETRALEPDNVYVYNLKEDKNFLIAAVADPDEAFKKIQWFPDSRHLVIVEDEKILIGDYDGTNRQVIYAGPFSGQFAFPWPNGNRLLILASLNGGSNLPPNLYAINLK